MPLWVMLGALSAVVAMSQAFRTVATVFAGGLQAEFGASAQGLGLFAAAFHFSFAFAQIPVGVALDLYGPRRTVGGAFLIAIVGALAAAFAPNLPVLIAGQLLIGIGCAPAWVGAIVFIASRYPPERFAQLSGLALSLSGIGMLATGTPLTFVVEQWGWRGGFLALAALAGLVLAAVLLWVSDDTHQPREAREGVVEAFVRIGPILAARHTLGIIVLGFVAYASFITLRGLWLAPILIERHGFTLVESGHVLLAASAATLLGPPAFGLLKVGDRARRFWIIGCTILYAAAFLLMALSSVALIDIAIPILLGFVTGFFVLLYADVRASYPAEVSGRAFALFNAAVFLGVAVMQWLTGLGASVAAAAGVAPFPAVLVMISAMLVAAALAFVLLPWPRGMRSGG